MAEEPLVYKYEMRIKIDSLSALMYADAIRQNWIYEHNARVAAELDKKIMKHLPYNPGPFTGPWHNKKEDEQL